MSVSKDLEQFASKCGKPISEIETELDKIRKEQCSDDRMALAILKSRYALKHLKENLEREKSVK
jgi:hypothetical protein